VTDQVVENRPAMYHGEKEWASCAHTEKDRKAARAWLQAVLTTDYGGPKTTQNLYPSRPYPTNALERILWGIGDGEWSGHNWPFRKLAFGFYADMWVGVSATFELPDGSAHAFWTEADDFTLAMGKTYERLQELAEAWMLEHPEDNREAQRQRILDLDAADAEEATDAAL